MKTNAHQPTVDNTTTPPTRTKPPLSRVMRIGISHLCPNCGSTKIGFLMLFGKRYCDNDECVNSKKQ